MIGTKSAVDIPMAEEAATAVRSDRLSSLGPAADGQTADPRIAIIGMHLEANAFAKITTRQDFDDLCWEEGDVINQLARTTSHLPLELPGFYERMDSQGSWTPVPLICVAAQPGGPMDDEVFQTIKENTLSRLRQAMPVAGVYISSHGASSSTRIQDTDGELVAAVREVVGPTVPIVVTHDLHCNISNRLIEVTDCLISYTTNPHIDQKARGAEAAGLLLEILGGMVPVSAFIRIPMAPPTVNLLTGSGPFKDLIELGQRFVGPEVCNVSVTGGFVFTDQDKCGMCVCVTARTDVKRAEEVALTVAKHAWETRHLYQRQLTSLIDAVSVAKDAVARRRKPVILADVADNPGGGGEGNTTYLLRALHESNAAGAVVGMFVDPLLAREAKEAGVGRSFLAVFNRKSGAFADEFRVEATVVSIADGRAVGRRGQYKGRRITLGTSVLLHLHGSNVLVAVVSLRRALNDPVMLETLGVDIAKAPCVVVKSRGHFRAGFDEFFSEDDIFEVDVPGLTSPVLTNFQFKNLPSPIFPLDQTMIWAPRITVKRVSEFTKAVTFDNTSSAKGEQNAIGVVVPVGHAYSNISEI